MGRHKQRRLQYLGYCHHAKHRFRASDRFINIPPKFATAFLGNVQLETVQKNNATSQDLNELLLPRLASCIVNVGIRAVHVKSLIVRLLPLSATLGDAPMRAALAQGGPRFLFRTAGGAAAFCYVKSPITTDHVCSKSSGGARIHRQYTCFPG